LFTEHERLPLHLGWKRSPELFNEEDLFSYMELMRNITEEIPDATAPAARRKRGTSHFGW